MNLIVGWIELIQFRKVLRLSSPSVHTINIYTSSIYLDQIYGLNGA